MDPININLVDIFPAAAILTISGVFIRLFGGIIADHKQFCDNRSFDITLNGSLFFLTYILFPASVAISLPHIAFSLPVRIACIFLFSGILTWFLVEMMAMSEKSSEKELPLLRYLIVLFAGKNCDVEAVKNTIRKSSPFVPSQLFIFILIYFLILAYQSNSLVFLSYMLTGMYVGLICVAATYGLKQMKTEIVNVYLVGVNEPIQNLTLLKVNDDNVRLRDKDKGMIISKSQIVRIEMVTNNKPLPTTNYL